MADEVYADYQDEELLAAYLEEAHEQIDILDQSLVALEQHPENDGLIQAVFRAAHTLKGSSAALGYRQIAELTHAMEDALDRVRHGEQALTPWLTDRLLEALDILRGLQRSIEETGVEHTAVAVGDLAEALRSAVEADAADAGAIDIADIQIGPLPDGDVAFLVQFAEDCGMPGIRAFMVLRTLETFGAITHVTPSREDIDADRVQQRLLLAVASVGDAATDEELAAAVKRVPEVEWVRVGRGEAAAGLSLHAPSRDAREVRAEAAPPQATSALSDSSREQQTVRVSVKTLDRIMNLVGELVLDRTRVAQLKDELSEHHPTDPTLRDLDVVANHLETIVAELHEQVLAARMLPVSQLFNRFPRLVRDLCRNLGKDVSLQVNGESEQLDRSVIERLVDPLTHLLRNAADHGMETGEARLRAGKSARGSIVLSARRQEDHVVIEVSDDGPGLDPERLRDKAIDAKMITSDRARAMSRQELLHLVFLSGFSTAARVTDVSGRGVGMDVVRRNVEALGGAIAVDSTLGVGTTFSLKIPLTLAIVRALVVRAGNVPMALPMALVEETLNVPRSALGSVRARPLFTWRDVVVPVINLTDAMPGCGASTRTNRLHLIIVRHEGRVVALAVDAVLGHQEIVVKSLGGFLGEVPGLAGATILGNGRVALIVDVGQLFAAGLLARAVAEAASV
jgi:two-component system chemotaxis sensor kinase CheA